ncbi:uncharacterized protein LOC130636879 [Hydractinia symbiolongicarpus]|uniref:uncharacterized protein LOC130636879 n=1 Tax=Hydractinia symbiolongicarpus TaxID=13093 RepID=UPI00254B9444|nr:uncharacterized protein LOC130636879 [Hydractinia symbiolongicarpus]
MRCVLIDFAEVRPLWRHDYKERSGYKVLKHYLLSLPRLLRGLLRKGIYLRQGISYEEEKKSARKNLRVMKEQSKQKLGSLSKKKGNNVKGKTEKKQKQKASSVKTLRKLPSANNPSDSDQSDSKDERMSSIGQLIDAAKLIDKKPCKNKRRLRSNEDQSSDAPLDKKKKTKGKSVQNDGKKNDADVNSTIYAALAADNLTDEGKKELKGIMDDFDPKLLQGLLSRLAKLEKYRGGNNEKENAESSSTEEQKASVLEKKEPESKDSNTAQLNQNLYDYPPILPHMFYQNPLMMQMYYTQYMLSQFPGTASFSNGTIGEYQHGASTFTGLPSSSKSVETNSVKKQYDNEFHETDKGSSIVTTSSTDLRKSTSRNSVIAEDKRNEMSEERFYSSTQTSVPYAVPCSVVKDTMNVTVVESVSQQPMPDKYENLDVSQKSDCSAEEQDGKRTCSKSSEDVDVVTEYNNDEIVKNSDDNDSNMSAEFNVQEEKVKEEDLPESLSKFIKPTGTSPRPSFLRFVDDINDPLKSGINDGEPSNSKPSMSKAETLQSSVITSSVAKVKEKPSNNVEVIAISDEEDEDKCEKSYHTLFSVKEQEKEKVKTAETKKISIAEFLAGIPPNLRTMLDKGTTTLSSILATAIRQQHRSGDTLEINASLKGLLAGVNASLTPALDPGPSSIPKLKKTANSPKNVVQYESIPFPESSRNLYLQDEDGDTILHIAIAKEDVKLSLNIIKRMKGFRMDIMNTLGQTPLHMALYVHKTEIIDALLHHGANVSILDGHGNSVLHIACEENSQVMLECLLKFASTSRDVYIKFFHMLKGKNNQGLAAIHIAIQKGNMGVIDRLIKFGAELNIQEETSGATALVMALQRYDWVLARRFIEEGASVNIPTYSGYYPLHYAAQAVNMPMVKLLISHEAEMGSKAVECPDVSEISREIKRLLEKEMRKRRRKRHQETQRKSP